MSGQGKNQEHEEIPEVDESELTFLTDGQVDKEDDADSLSSLSAVMDLRPKKTQARRPKRFLTKSFLPKKEKMMDRPSCSLAYRDPADTAQDLLSGWNFDDALLSAITASTPEVAVEDEAQSGGPEATDESLRYSTSVKGHLEASNKKSDLSKISKRGSTFGLPSKRPSTPPKTAGERLFMPKKGDHFGYPGVYSCHASKYMDNFDNIQLPKISKGKHPYMSTTKESVTDRRSGDISKEEVILPELPIERHPYPTAIPRDKTAFNENIILPELPMSQHFSSALSKCPSSMLRYKPSLDQKIKLPELSMDQKPRSHFAKCPSASPYAEQDLDETIILPELTTKEDERPFEPRDIYEILKDFIDDDDKLPNIHPVEGNKHMSKELFSTKNVDISNEDDELQKMLGAVPYHRLPAKHLSNTSVDLKLPPIQRQAPRRSFCGKCPFVLPGRVSSEKTEVPGMPGGTTSKKTEVLGMLGGQHSSTLAKIRSVKAENEVNLLQNQILWTKPSPLFIKDEKSDKGQKPSTLNMPKLPVKGSSGKMLPEKAQSAVPRDGDTFKDRKDLARDF